MITMGTTRIAVESNNKNKLGEEEMDVIPRKCKVSFSNIFIREYALQPGDNPSVTAGVPIALGSEVLREKTVDIDKFERKRRKHRRYCKWDFQLTPQQRERRLIEHGHSKADIAQAVRKVRKARHARDLSIHNKKWDHFHEVLEQTSRRFKKTLSLKRKTNLVTLAPTETTEATAVSSSVRPAMVRRMERKE